MEASSVVISFRLNALNKKYIITNMGYLPFGHCSMSAYIIDRLYII